MKRKRIPNGKNTLLLSLAEMDLQNGKRQL
jgi:hypothetical protein